MAWSRTYLQVHWLTDAMAGALLGSSVSLLVFAIAQRRVHAMQAREHLTYPSRDQERGE